MEIKIKKIVPDAQMPTRAYEGDAGYDLYAHRLEYDYARDLVTYHTGIAMEIPMGYVGLIFPRSSIRKTLLSLSNSVGVIDSGYRGEISASFRRFKRTTALSGMEMFDRRREYREGERIGQIVIMPIPAIEFVEVEELSSSERGTGGYGSSGK